MGMGWVLMSERELNRVEVLSQVSQGRMTATTAANVLGLSRRQAHRLLKKFQTDGPAAIRHRARGRASNTRGLPGKYVDSYEYPDGRLEFRWKGVALPYSVFDKDQRVTHDAITENKRLGAVLEFIKEEQDKAPPKKQRAGKQRSRYKPNGRRNDGWNSLAARSAKEARKASQGCDI